MKQILFFEILNKLKDKPKLMRKIKIFAAVGIVGFLITGTLIIWAGVSAMNYVASSADQFIQAPFAQSQVENIKTELKDLPQLQAMNCWNKAQSLLAVQPWLERTTIDNLTNLKAACFEAKPNVKGALHDSNSI